MRQYGKVTDRCINQEIRSKEVRLIDENGENRGIVAIREALALGGGRRVGSDRNISPGRSPCLQNFRLRQIQI